jgi:hypothetical protein
MTEGVAKDFMMIPFVSRVQDLDDIFEVLCDDEDDWEILASSRPLFGLSYAAAVAADL